MKNETKANDRSWYILFYSRYQMWINLCAVFLLIVSIVFIFCAIILMKFYQVEKLSFWSEVFIVTPAYIIALGFYIFIIGFFGISIAGLENRCLLIFYALLMTFCFFAQIGTIFSALELRKYLAEAAASHSNVNYDLNRYLNLYKTLKHSQSLFDFPCSCHILYHQFQNGSKIIQLWAP